MLPTAGRAGVRGRAETLTPLPIVVVVRGVVAALEPCYSGFVIAGEDLAVIEAGEAPRHGVHVTWSQLGRVSITLGLFVPLRRSDDHFRAVEPGWSRFAGANVVGPVAHAAHRLQLLPVLAHHRHRFRLVRIGGLPLQLDTSTPLHRRAQQHLGEPSLNRRPRVGVDLLAGHGPIGEPQLQAQPRPVGLAVKRCLTRGLDDPPQRRGERVRIVETERAGRRRCGGCLRRCGRTVGLGRVASAALRLRFGGATGRARIGDSGSG